MKVHEAFALALDPAQVLRHRGLEPDPWQQELLRSNANRILLNCSRQSGKSTTVAALALHTALFKPASLTLVLSPSLRQSSELFRKIIDCYNALGRPMRAAASATRLELANQARVVCLPGKEETIRSFSGVRLLIIDEAARVSDDLYRSVRPMLAVSQGRLVCLSTPFGKRGFFWREWSAADSDVETRRHGDAATNSDVETRRHGDAATDVVAASECPRVPASLPDWHRVRITWRDCPRITPAFLAEERRSLGDHWVRQEYECSFEALEGLVYPDFDESCGGDDWPDVTGQRVGGLDFGFRNPFCALWGVLDRDDVLWIDRERYLCETPIHEHAAALPRDVLWYADPAGRTEIEELRHAGLKVRAGVNDIRAGVAAVTARIRTGRLKVRRQTCPNLLAEARLYRYGPAQLDAASSELPIDAHNHALGALRYLISRLDAGLVARIRRTPPSPSAAAELPWLRHDNDELWS